MNHDGSSTRSLHLYFIASVAILASGCSGFLPEDTSGSAGANSKLGVSFEQFQKIVRRDCNHCHGGADSLYPTISNFNNFLDEASWLAQPGLIVPGSREQSAMYYRLIFARGKVANTNNNMPFGAEGYPVTMTDSDAEIIGGYIDTLGRGGSGGAKDLTIVDKSSAESSVAKAKLIINGQAVTNSELQLTSSGGKLNRGQLKNLITDWLETPDSQKKMLAFFKLTTGQDEWTYPDGGNNLFGQIRPQGNGNNQNRNRLAWENNLKESFARTALQLVNDNKPLNEIVTTRQHFVTSAILSSLSFADGAGSPATVAPNNQTFNNHLNTLLATDFTDWRLVTLSSGAGATAFNDMAAIRGVAAGQNYPLRLPRLGFFNTLGFQIKFETNDANDFRVTASEMLIVATNQVFEAGDPSPNGNLAAVDTQHAEPSSSCYQCHRLMDPIRETFRVNYNQFYRFNDGADAVTPAFSFRGHQGPSSDVQQMAQTVANHPEFAKGWVAKFCSYANSAACDQDHPEFLRIVEVFKSSNLNFKTLVAEVLSSPIVTAKGGGDSGVESASAAGLISATRANHFCHALTARYQQVVNATGVGTVPENLCGLNQAIAGYATSLGADTTSRGAAGLSQSPDSSALGLQSMEKLCRGLSPSIVGQGFSDEAADIDQSLDNMVQIIMGLPTNHPRYQTTRAVLRQIFDYGQATHNLNNTAALTEAFVFACSSPDIAGMGL